MKSVTIYTYFFIKRLIRDVSFVVFVFCLLIAMLRLTVGVLLVRFYQIYNAKTFFIELLLT